MPVTHPVGATRHSKTPKRGAVGEPSPSSVPLRSRAFGFLDRHFAVVLILPGFLWLAGLLLYPVGLNAYYSFTNKSITFPGVDWVGFENYREILVDGIFWDAAINSFWWTLLGVGGQLVFALFSALALERVTRGRGLLRLLLTLPWMFSSVVVASSWRLMLDPFVGVINGILVDVGLINEPLSWFGDAGRAFPTAIALNIWFGIPFMLVAILAGLQTIDRALYEAADVDGASYWQQVWHITLPGLRSVIGTLIILRTIWVANNFDFIFLTTGGGPRDSSITVPVYAFRVGWTRFDVGQMAAVSMILITILVALIGVFLRLFPIDREVTDG